MGKALILFALITTLPFVALAQLPIRDAQVAAAATTTKAADKCAKAVELAQATRDALAAKRSWAPKVPLQGKDLDKLNELLSQAKESAAAAKEANVAGVSAFDAAVDAFDKVKAAVVSTATSADAAEQMKLKVAKKIAESSKEIAGIAQLKAAETADKTMDMVKQADKLVQDLTTVATTGTIGLAIADADDLLGKAKEASISAKAATTASTTLADNPKNTTATLTDKGKLIGSKNLKFGVGFGGSYNMNHTYSYSLGASSNAASNYALTRERLTPYAGVVSGTVAYNKTAYYFRHFDAQGQPIGEAEPDPYWLSALLALNLADFTAAGEGFNRKLDLGVGVGIRFDEHFQLGIFLEGTSQRFLRDYYLQFLNSPVPDYKTNAFLTGLNPSDDNYFVSRTVLSVGFKLIYMLTADRPKEKDEIKARAELSEAQ